MSLVEILRYAFIQSDAVGRGIVILLSGFSAWSWCIICGKALSMRNMRSECRKFNSYYDNSGSPLAVGVYLNEISGPLGNICRVGIETLCEILGIEERRRSTFQRNAVLPRQLTAAEIDKIRTRMNQQLNKESRELEGELGLLSIFITVSPFLGLFGTVWGVMATFIAIAQTSSIEISAIAPGISGALLTTVAGLVVAIPAVWANTVISAKIDTTFNEMDIFVDDFLASLKLEDSPSASNESKEG